MRFQLVNWTERRNEKRLRVVEYKAAKEDRREKWHLYFAWWPTKVDRHDYVWLEWIERACHSYDRNRDAYRCLKDCTQPEVFKSGNLFVVEGRRHHYKMEPQADGSFLIRDTYRNDPDLKALFPSAVCSRSKKRHFHSEVRLSDADMVKLKLMTAE